jgi:transmembrane sensor
MASKRIEKLLIKYLINQASYSELDELEIWIKDPINENEFINYVKTNYAIEYNLKKPDKNKTINIIDNLIEEEKRILKIRRIQKFTKYAAVFIGILISIYTFKNELFNTSSNDKDAPIIVNANIIEPGTDKATLTLEDGSQIVLEKGEPLKTKNANSNGEEIIYKANQSNTKARVYNYLTIPRGGQFFIKLSDGTQVWLNSESQLKYPVSFVDGKERVVELVYGEAYFDVSPSAIHKGSKFKVLNQAQEIEVIGTEFNVKAYKDESHIYTTLVEGKVLVNYGNRKQNLLPNEQSNFNPNTKDLVITEVDVYNEISWKDGVFSFERKTLKEMTKVLSRWYDVEIVIKNKSIENEEFVGILRKNKKLEEILTNIKNFGIIKNFQVMDNKKIVIE